MTSETGQMNYKARAASQNVADKVSQIADIDDVVVRSVLHRYGPWAAALQLSCVSLHGKDSPLPQKSGIPKGHGMTGELVTCRFLLCL